MFLIINHFLNKNIKFITKYIIVTLDNGYFLKNDFPMLLKQALSFAQLYLLTLVDIEERIIIFWKISYVRLLNFLTLYCYLNSQRQKANISAKKIFGSCNFFILLRQLCRRENLDMSVLFIVRISKMSIEIL